MENAARRWHTPNPLDRLFLAIDEAWRRLGLPGTEIHLRLEFAGEIDLQALRRGLRGARQAFPAIASRLAPRGLRRIPAWRLGRFDEPMIQLHDARGMSDNERHAVLDRLLAERRDWSNDSPFRLELFRGATNGDLLVARWPHALMDARGGVTVLETIAELGEAGDVERVESRGDEAREDFGVLDPRARWRDLAAVFRASGRTSRRPKGWRELRLAQDEPMGDPGALRTFVRRLSVEEAARARDEAMRVCGFARLADYLRACVVCAMRELAPPTGAVGEGYSTVHLVDNRRRRDQGPVCHNVFSGLPVYVPAEVAGGVRAVADAVMESTTALLSSGVMQSRLRGLAWLTQLSTPLLGALIARALSGRRAFLPLGLAEAPSVPLGFMGPFSRPLPRFCGAVLRNIYGVRAPSPRAGYTLTLNAAQERMNIAVAYYDGRTPSGLVERLVRRSAALILAENA